MSNIKTEGIINPIGVYIRIRPLDDSYKSYKKPLLKNFITVFENQVFYI